MTPPALKTRVFDLPPLVPGAKAPFSDAAAARRWLEELPIDNARASNDLLRRQLALLTSCDMSPERRLEILEALRPRVIAVQGEHAKKYRGKPAPQLPHRKETLTEVVELWEALCFAYQRCLESWPRADKGSAGVQAQALQRALDAMCRLVMEHYYAYVAPPRAVYGALHRLYAYGERSGVATLRVRDASGESGDVSPRDTYVRALLFDASLPREHRPHVLAVIYRLLTNWGEKVSVQPIADPPSMEVPPLYTDLEKDRGLRHVHDPTTTARQFDMSAVARMIHERLHLLRHGRAAGEIDLGAELTPREFESLLIALHRQWCEGTVKRQFERQPTEALAHVSTGLTAAHFYLGKRPFRQPFSSPALPARRGRTRADTAAERVKVAAGYLVDSKIIAEQWMIRDESLTGIGLIRPKAEQADAWLSHGLLIAVRPRGGNNALVGTIQWLEESKEGDLHVGVRLLPGVPTAIAARVMGAEEYFPALVLLPLPPLAAPSSIVLPTGTFAPQRLLEVFHQGVDRIQLTALLESGVDFERVAFMPAGSVYVPTEVEAATS